MDDVLGASVCWLRVKRGNKYASVCTAPLYPSSVFGAMAFAAIGCNCEKIS